MRRLSLSCTKVSFIPSSFAPPHPKQWLAGFGASVMVAGFLSSVLSVVFTRILCVKSLPFLKPVQPCCAQHAERRAAACAFPPAVIPPKSSRRAQFAFRLSRQSPDATHSAADFAHKNTAPARKALRALSNESAARWHQIRAAIPAIDTYRLPDASSVYLPACACAALHPALQAAQRTPCAFLRRAWKTFHGAGTPRGSPAPTDRCECP